MKKEKFKSISVRNAADVIESIVEKDNAGMSKLATIPYLYHDLLLYKITHKQIK